MQTFFRTLALLILYLCTAHSHAECSSTSSKEVLQSCLAQDLWDSDLRINTIYNVLIENLNEIERNNLRNEQLNWFKNRSKACALSSRESNRGKWLLGILANEDQALCVIQHTFSRVVQMELLLKQKFPTQIINAPPAPQAPVFSSSSSTIKNTLPTELTYDEENYRISSTKEHPSGSWYYEIWIDRAKIAQLGSILISPGIASAKSIASPLINIRQNYIEPTPLIVGIAINLNQRNIQFHYNGVWQTPIDLSNEPGFTKNNAYKLAVQTTCPINELIERNLIKINLGENSFAFPPSSEYQAWNININ
jgi:uncharacterized protein YecT (DUF1311 family)